MFSLHTTKFWIILLEQNDVWSPCAIYHVYHSYMIDELFILESNSGIP